MRGETNNPVFNDLWNSRVELYRNGDGSGLFALQQTLIRTNERMREIYWALREELNNEAD